MAAQTIWRGFPAEIASDLSRFHHRRIADWHTGVMNSHELLELCEHMDDDGALKTAAREGEPSQHRKAVLQIANELAVLRAGMVPGADGQKWDAQLFFTPRRLRELAADMQESADVRQSLDDDWDG